MFNPFQFLAERKEKKPLKSYRDNRYWLSYWAFVPEKIRNLRTSDPDEDWWVWRGHNIHLDRYDCPGATVSVIIVHGAGGYGRMLSPYGYLLQSLGVRVVAPDLPNYGLTQAAAEMFDYQRWIDCITDLIALEQVRHHGKVVLFGLSIGGFLALLAAARNGRVAGVMATTLADPSLSHVRDMFAKNKMQSRFGLPLLPALDQIFGKLRLPIKWFCKMDRIANNPDLVNVITHDPLGGGNSVPVHFMNSLFEIGGNEELLNSLSCPVLLMQPEDDLWTPFEASKPVFDNLLTDKELVLLANCGHLPIEEPGINQLQEAVSKFLARI